MKNISKIKFLLISILIGGVSALICANSALASAFNTYNGKNLRDCYHISKLQENLDLLKNEQFENAKNKQEMLALKKTYISQMQTMIDTCQKLQKGFPNIFANAENLASDQDAIKTIFGQENKYIGKDKFTDEEIHDIYAQYLYKQIAASGNKDYGNSLLKTFADNNVKVDQTYVAIQTKYQGNRCGNNYPFGCPAKQKCWNCKGTRTVPGQPSQPYDDYSCSETAPAVSPTGTEHCSVIETSGDKGTTWVIPQVGGASWKIETKATGESTQTSSLLGIETEKMETSITGENTYVDVTDVVRSNAGYCNIEGLKTDYMANCYSCVVVSTLIRTFMNISNITYPLTQAAGVKLLAIGMCLWLAFFVLQKISSFVSLEPMKILQELFTFFFKCLLAYTLVTSGLRMITDLLVDPILKAGADYGIGIIDSVMSDWSTTEDSTKSSDEYYQMEKVKDQQDAAKVEQEKDVKVLGQLDATKTRPENLSQLKESGRNYCQTSSGDAFGAHQLDYRWQAFNFAQQCSDPRFKNALAKVGIKKSCGGNDACGKKVRDALLPVVNQICSEPGGKQKMQEWQEKYHRENNFVPAFNLINAHCKLNPKLTLSNYNQPQYFTLSAALISGYNHNQTATQEAVGNIKCSGTYNEMGNQLYDGLDKWWINNKFNSGKNHRYLDEKKMCQDILAGKNIDTTQLASSSDSSYSSSPTYSSVQHNYYLVKDKNESYSLIPISSDGKTVVDSTVFDKIMKISRKADQAVSLNFVIGDAIICHSMHAGAYQFSTKITKTIGINFYFPDIWLWACGALIWFFALMVTIGVNFYLLDLSFKVGFALLALPITIGLWPFNKFKDEFVKCIKIIANAAGTFMFLGISTGLSVVLISTALGGTDALFDAINNDDKRYISEKFSLTGGSFLLILFAFLYSHKLISETVSKMADAFFSAVTNGLNPMHKKTTQTIDFAKKQATNAISEIGGGIGKSVNKNVVNPLKNGAQNMTKKAARGVVKGVSSLMGGGKK